jgi:hypothetical protein
MIYRFSRDSPLEETVMSEPVSGGGVSSARDYGTIPRPLWMIIEAEKGYFGSKTTEFQSCRLAASPAFRILSC